jgi:3-methyladenine DNA glycosylase AlkD
MSQDRLDKLVAQIDVTCRKLADPKRVAKYARYFKEGFDAYGVDHESSEWLAKRQIWWDDNRYLGLKGFLTLGERLFATGKYEHGALAFWFVSKFRKEIRPTAFTGIGKWFDGGVRNWAHTDAICSELLAPRLQCGAVRLRTLASWRKSPHRFKRRAVPVAMLGLLKTAPDYGPLLEFIAPMMLDGQRVVHQGLGWFLREAWKKQPEPVEVFLTEWRDSAPRLIYQYATEKMTPAGKERFRRAKSLAAAG